VDCSAVARRAGPQIADVSHLALRDDDCDARVWSSREVTTIRTATRSSASVPWGTFSARGRWRGATAA